MGSKSRIAKHIVPIIQKYIDENSITTYIEPFVGGANVIDKIKCENKLGSDLNRYLIALLRHVRDGNDLYEGVPKDLYDKARTAFNNGDTFEFEDWEIGNIGFIASYNGRWFDGGYAKPGYEKTKNGERYRDYYREAKDNLMEQAPNLKGIRFIHEDYRSYEPNGCLIYCDPPYANSKQYANATKFNYDEFWNTMREWSKDNIVLISEQIAPDDFECIWEKELTTTLDKNSRSSAVEKLFVYKSHNI